MSVEVEIQKAIFTRLTNGLTVLVFDDVPDNQPKPYVVVGDDTVIEWDTDNNTGFESTITLHVWSDQPGRGEVKTIQGEIYDLLHRAEFSVIGYNLINCAFEFGDTVLDVNGVTRHGVQRFRLILTKS
jgi:hypothetical protein